MRTRLNPLALLERADKWYLSSGTAALFAPAFPNYLDTPGFWDEVYWADVRLERLFCILLLDARDRPLTLRRATRRWTPDRLTQIYTVEGQPSLQVTEERVVTPKNTFAVRLTLTNTLPTPAPLHLLLWSLQDRCDQTADPTGPNIEAVTRDPDAFAFTFRPAPDARETPAEVYGWGEGEEREEGEAGEGRASAHTPKSRAAARPPGPKCELETALTVALGAGRMPDSWTMQFAERSDTGPLWETSVLPQKFCHGKLPQEEAHSPGTDDRGLLHLVLHYEVEVPASGAESLTFGASIALERAEALANLRADLSGDVIIQSHDAWAAYFESVPYFECSDPYIERAYWYRWYGLRLLTVNVGSPRLTHPCVFEGIGAFRSHVSYSAQCHMRELAWGDDPAKAMGSLENFLAAQETAPDNPDEGFLPGHLYLFRPTRGFYHANWGSSALHLYYLTGDDTFVQRVYPGLARYAAYCRRERDREASGLVDIVDQGETGQEYSSRYLFADPNADKWGRFRIKGVDASVYLYQLYRALSVFARVLTREAEADTWDECADATADAICSRMWDAGAALFKDVNPVTSVQSPAKSIVGFYPFLADIAGPEHLPLWAHLDNPRTFGTPFPVPSCSVDDPFFSAEAEWKGRRTSCPWNGRIWPMTNSHVCDALANAARTLDPALRQKAADLVTRCLHLLFTDGDPKRPNSYEHYSPFTGLPSLYRGVDDYQHSWIVDLILRHVAGIQPEPGETGGLVVDPLPLPLAQLRAENIRVRGHRVDVVWSRAEGFVVNVDGRERVQLPTVQRVEVPLD